MAFPRESHSRKIRSKNKSVYENTVELHAPTHGLLTVTNSRVSFCCQSYLPTIIKCLVVANEYTEPKEWSIVPRRQNEPIASHMWTTLCEPLNSFSCKKNKKYKSLNERKQIKGKAEFEYGCYMKGCVQQWWLGLNPKKKPQLLLTGVEPKGLPSNRRVQQRPLGRGWVEAFK